MWHWWNIKWNDQIHKWQIQNCNNQIVQYCFECRIFPRHLESRPNYNPSLNKETSLSQTITEAYVSIATWGKYSVRLLTYDYKTFSKPTKSWRKVKLDFCPNTEHLTTFIPSTLSLISTYTKTKPNLCLLYWLWKSFWFNLAWRTLSKTTGKRDWRENFWFNQ